MKGRRINPSDGDDLMPPHPIRPLLVTDRVEAVARRRLNHDRARAFGLPVLRSLHPDVLLVGYSIFGYERPPGAARDRIVEANHVVRSSLETSSPLAFTTRTWKFGFDLKREFHSHAVDHVRNGTLNAPSLTEADRDELLQSLEDAARREIEVRIDGVPRGGTAFDLDGSTFVRLPASEGIVMISIAAPLAFVEAGFSGAIPE
jgi:hypothetical protein